MVDPIPQDLDVMCSLGSVAVMAPMRPNNKFSHRAPFFSRGLGVGLSMLYSFLLNFLACCHLGGPFDPIFLY